MASPPDLLQRRLRLRGDSSFHHLPSGLLLENDVLSFGLRGQGLHDLLSALAPRLDGSRTVAEILEPFPEEMRESIASLLAVLFERTLLVDQPVEEAVTLSPAELERFSSQLDLLIHRLEHPRAGLRAVRSARVLVIGTGPVPTVAASALLRYGIGKVDLLVSSAAADRERVAKAVEDLEADGIEAGLRIFAETPTDDDLAAVLEDLSAYALVIYASDRSSLRDVILVNRRCARDRRPLLPGFVFGGRALMGPLLETPNLGCWVCGLHRQSEDLFPTEQAMEFRRPAETPGRVFEQEMEPSPLLVAAIGQSLAFESFKVLAGLRECQCRQGILRTTEEPEQNSQSDLFPFSLGGCTGYCHPFLTRHEPSSPDETTRDDRRPVHA